LYTQQLESKTLSSEIQRPSSDQLWQIPGKLALPKPPLVFFRELPLDEQDTSYLAAAPNIFSFVCKSINGNLPNILSH
jgi:hypothetical protein